RGDHADLARAATTVSAVGLVRGHTRDDRSRVTAGRVHTGACGRAAVQRDRRRGAGMSDTTRFPVVDAGIRYIVAPDDLIPEGIRPSAIVFARAIDELTTKPVGLPITVTPAGKAFDALNTRSAVNPRAVDGGVIGLVGTPERALPALSAVAYEVGLTARA